jgi:hypothetical protein
MERLISGIWCELLRVPGVARDQNFFDLGGTSLLAIVCRERLRQATGQDVALTDMFSFPTVRALAWHLGAAHRPTDASQERGRRRRATLLHSAHIEAVEGTCGRTAPGGRRSWPVGATIRFAQDAAGSLRMTSD